MNKQEAIKQLIALLSLFPITLHPDIVDDIMSILKNSGAEGRFLTAFKAKTNFLMAHRKDAHYLHEEFEHIGGGIYSMHLPVAALNIRVLYALQGEDTILLLAFYEREGKKQTDYTRKLPEAKRRLGELMD